MEKKFNCILLYILVVSILWLSPSEAQPVRIGYGSFGVVHLPGWVALEGGYFLGEGVNAELIYIAGGPQTVSALLGGNVDFVQVYSQPVLAAHLRGADTVLIAGLFNQPPLSIITTPGIEKPEDLRGKKIGITTYGSATDLALRLALKKWRLSPERDVTILQIRGLAEILGALKSKAIDAGVLSPPTDKMAAEAGFKNLVYIPQMGISFQHTTLATTRRYLQKNRAVAIRVLRAQISGIHRIKADKEFASKVLAKYLKIRDPEILSYTYDTGVPFFKTPPYPSLEGIKATLDFLAEREPKAKHVNAADFVDLSLLEEIDKTGVLKKQ